MLWVHVSRARPSHHRVSPRHICTHVSYLVRSYFITHNYTHLLPAKPDLAEVRGAGAAVRHHGPAHHVPALEVHHGQVLVLVVHVGQQHHREPGPDGEQLPDLLIHVDIVHNLARVGVQDHDVRVPDGLGVEHRHLADEGYSAAVEVEAGGEEEGLDGLGDALERNVEVRLGEVGEAGVCPGPQLDVVTGHREQKLPPAVWFVL